MVVSITIPCDLRTLLGLPWLRIGLLSLAVTAGVFGADTFVKIEVDPSCLNGEIVAFVDRRQVNLHDNYGRIVKRVPASGVFEIDLGDNQEHRVHLEKRDQAKRRLQVTTERRVIAGETTSVVFGRELCAELGAAAVASVQKPVAPIPSSNSQGGAEILVPALIIIAVGGGLAAMYFRNRAAGHAARGEFPVAVAGPEVVPPQDMGGWPPQMALRYPHLVPVQKVKSGGAGTIFLVTNSRAKNRHGAVKILHPQYSQTNNADAQRFLAEPKVLSRLSDLKAAPQLYSVTFDNPGEDAVLWYEMEWLQEFVTLRKFIGGKGRTVTLPQFQRVFPLFLRHVSAMHSRGVVHRDLTPENVMVDSTLSQLKIIDFGLVRFTGGLAGDDQATFNDIDTIKEVIGKPSYCAPEQWLDGLNAATEAADWYAIGSIAWELLLGTPPYRRPDEVRSSPRSSEALSAELRQRTQVAPDWSVGIAALLNPDAAVRLDAARTMVRGLG